MEHSNRLLKKYKSEHKDTEYLNNVQKKFESEHKKN